MMSITRSLNCEAGYFERNVTMEWLMSDRPYIAKRHAGM
jgi:hypothetical protein